MIKISVISDFPIKDNKIEGAVLFFAINDKDSERPFVFGAHSHPHIGGHAAWSSSSSFGLVNLNDIDGLAWRDWRASLKKLNCDWVIPIIENAEITGNIKSAASEVLRIYESDKKVNKSLWSGAADATD